MLRPNLYFCNNLRATAFETALRGGKLTPATNPSASMCARVLEVAPIRAAPVRPAVAARDVVVARLFISAGSAAAVL